MSMQRRQYIGIVGGLYGEKRGRMCARSFVLGRLSGEGGDERGAEVGVVWCIYVAFV